MTMQLEIYHENYQYFYPSEPFEKNHITMRHPVGQLNLIFHGKLMPNLHNTSKMLYLSLD